MVSRVLVRKQWRDLYKRKGSIAALVVIVAVGVGSYVGFAGVWRDMDSARRNYYSDLRLADFVVDCKKAPLWTLDSLSSLPNVSSVRGRVNLSVLIQLPGQTVPVSGTAISMPADHGPVLNDVALRTGTWFSGKGGNEVILNYFFAEANGLKPGNRIKVTLLDKQHDLLVVGTCVSPEFVYLIPSSGGIAPDPSRFGVMYFPGKFLQESCDLDGAYNQVIGLLHDNSSNAMRVSLDRIKKILDPFGATSAEPILEQPSVRFLADELKGLRISSRVTPAIFLAVAILVLNILISRMIVQQRGIIGTFKALGYSSKQVISHYITYGMVIGLTGGILGCIFGIWIQGAMIDLYQNFYMIPGLTIHFYLDLLLLGLAISIGSAVLGTLKGLKFAVKLQPAEAMRPPPPEKGGKVLPEMIPFLWRPLPFRWKLMLRTIFRNPFRSCVSIFAGMISTSLIVMTLANLDALNYLIQYEFERVSHQDWTISLRNPEDLEALAEIKLFPTISRTEPQLSIAFDFSNGPYKKRTGVIGLTEGETLYTPLDKSGNPVHVPDAGLVLSKKLAEILNVSTGDCLLVRALIGKRRQSTASVVATVDTYLGLSAYADINYVNRLIGGEYMSNRVLVKSFQPSAPISFTRELNKRPAIIGIGERRRSLTQLDKTFGKSMGTMITMMILFSGLIAFGSVLNTALVSLSERKREVGTLRVIGYSPLQVWTVFSGESLLLNGIGIILGIFLGIGLSNIMSIAYSTELYRFPVVIYSSRLLLSSIIMVCFIGIAQLIVLRLVRNFKWLSALAIKE